MLGIVVRGEISPIGQIPIITPFGHLEGWYLGAFDAVLDDIDPIIKVLI